jgi:hypothetical protein
MNPIDAETARPGHQRPRLVPALHMHRATRLAGSRYRLRPQIIDRGVIFRRDPQLRAARAPGSDVAAGQQRFRMAGLILLN